MRWDGDATAPSVSVDDVTYWDRSSPPTPVVTYSYDRDDNVTREALVGGSRTWTWTRGRVTKLAQTLPDASFTTALAYDAGGRIRSETTGTARTAYAYDAAGQLTSETPPTGPATTYTYDTVGRRATATTGTDLTTNTYDAASQLLSSEVDGDETTYTYDEAGRRLSQDGPGGSTSLSYDAAGRLSTVTSGPDTQTRAYDADGRLLGLLSDDGSNVSISRFDWDDASALPQLASLSTEDGAANLVHGPLTAVAVRRGSVARGIPSDALGSVIATPATNGVANASGYDAFGGPDGQGRIVPRLGYRGELTIDGLVHLHARDYDPASGGFTSVDPLDGVVGTPAIANPYQYADNDPVGLVDPFGMRTGRSVFGGDPLSRADRPRSLQGQAQWLRDHPWRALTPNERLWARLPDNFFQWSFERRKNWLAKNDPSLQMKLSNPWDLGDIVASLGVGVTSCSQGVRSGLMGGNANYYADRQGTRASFDICKGVGIAAPLVGGLAGAGARTPASAPEGAGWTLPRNGGGAEIQGRWYTEHALERMAPDTPQVRAELGARSLARAEANGLKAGSSEFGEWWRSYGPAPRGIPPSVVEAEIAHPGSTGVRVITGRDGQVITVIPR